MAIGRGGLPTPQIADVGLQQWVQRVSERLAELDAAASGANRTAGQALTQVREIDVTPATVTTADLRPDEPTNLTPTLEGAAVISIAMLFWENPFEHYRLHARTEIWRHTADSFNDATRVGESVGISYVDSTVQGDTTYYYWIRWESQNGLFSDPSDSIELTPATDPAQAGEDLTDDIVNDPLTATLLAQIDEAGTSQAVGARIAELWAYVYDLVREAQVEAGAVALSALTMRVTTAEGEITSLAEDITALEASSTGTVGLGPAQNRFSGDTLDEAFEALARYGQSNPGWLGEYDREAYAVEITWGG